MIEAPELVTATQRQLHDRYRDIHRKFFPEPPVFVKAAQIVASAEAKAEPPVNAKPERQRDWLLVSGPPKPINIAKIMRLVAERWNVDTNDLRSERRSRDIVIPRQIVCLLARILTLKSYPSIGNALGGRDHTTAMASVKKFNWLGEQLREELGSGAALGVWVDRAFELVKRAR